MRDSETCKNLCTTTPDVNEIICNMIWTCGRILASIHAIYDLLLKLS